MAEPNTIARPYAEAVFGLADASGKLADWLSVLSALAQASENEVLRAATLNPNFSTEKIAALYLSIFEGKLSPEEQNLVRVLAENHRLGLLPRIRDQFERLKNERESTIDAEIQTAFDLNSAQRAELVARLERQTGRKLKVRVVVEEKLIGGIRVIMGDRVIDGSVRAQLAQLENALVNA